MFLCQTHYNQLIFHELLKIKQAKTCQHPKHKIYLNETKSTKKANSSKNLIKIPKRLIEVLELDEYAEICNMCKKKTDKDSEYLQNEKYEEPILNKKSNLNDNDNLQNLNDDDNLQNLSDNNNLQNELKEIKTCQHPKHEIYLSETRITSKTNSTKNFTKVPKRLINVLGLDEFAEICTICRKRTDDDSEYNQHKEYKAPNFRKADNDNVLKIGNHTYLFRKDVLYTGEELKQFESDYQDIIAQLTISNKISLSSKIIKTKEYKNVNRINLQFLFY